MMEIMINELDWKSADRIKRMTEIIDKLKNSGWEKFGHNGTIVLFKDVDEEKAETELKDLQISEVRAEAWEEELYSSNVF